MTLQELQRRFCESVRDDHPFHGLPINGDGLGVYRNNYREQLRSSLRTAFPYLTLWLGDSEFDRAAEAHIALHFPHSWTLDHYGHDFPETVEILFPQDPEIPELAWLDWAMAEALVADDEQPVDIESLDGVDWDAARIVFVSSLRISVARSNAAEIWASLEEKSTPSPATLSSEPHALLVWRRDLLPCLRSIPIWEFQIISALRHGFSFADACEILRLRFGAEGAINAAGGMLARWFSDELIVTIDANPRSTL